MHTTTRALAVAATLAVLGAPLAGQTISDRIAAVRQQRSDAAVKATKARKTRMLQALLFTELSVDFAATPARDAFEFLRTSMGTNLVVRFTDEPPGSVPSIDPTTPITLKVDDMPAIDVLDLVLEQCSTLESCTWQLRPSFIEAGSKDRLSVDDARVVRVYPIDALVFEPAMFDDALSSRLDDAFRDAYAYNPWIFPGPYGSQGGFSGSFGATPNNRQPLRSGGNDRDQRIEQLIELITDVVEPSGWQRNGGAWASIRYNDGALIVTAPDFVQRQIGGYPKVRPPKGPAPSTARSPSTGSSGTP